MKTTVSIIRRLALSLASLAMLAACQQQEITPDIIDSHFPDDGVVRIANVLHAAPTRTTTDGTTNYPGADLALSIDYGSGHRYTALNRPWSNASGQWTPQEQMLWKDATTQVTLFAYAPYQANVEDLSRMQFSVSTQQDIDGMLNSDLVGYAKSGFTPATDLDAEGKVVLPMMHKLAKLNVRLTYGNQWGSTPPEVVAVSINGTHATGTYNATTATFSAANAQPDAEAISMYVNHVPALGEAPAYTQYEAIIIPQEVPLGTALVQIVLADASRYAYTLTANHNFISGTETAINLRVGKDRVELVDNITVTPWLDATDDKAGDSEEVIAFPDRNFVKYLNEAHNVPLDAYGEIDMSNADVLTKLQQITHLDVNNKSIKSLKGLEYLTALTHLECNNNLLTSLQLYNHKKLQYLDCSNNQLTTLTLFNISELTNLNCSNNPLPSMSLTDCRKIERLNCSRLKLSSLTTNSYNVLQVLDISYNQFTSFDVSYFVNLTQLDCSNNAIWTLRLGNNPNLRKLDCSNNAIESIATNGLTALQLLYCNKNKLTTLDLTPLTSLTHISCYENQLTSLNVAGLDKLKDLHCAQNKLTSLDLTGCIELTGLHAYNNKLTSLNLRDVTNLKSLQCQNSSLTTLDVSKQSQLDFLSCHANKLITLDVSGLTQLNLETLYCGCQVNDQDNQLTLTYGNNAPGTLFNPDNSYNLGVTAVEKP